MDTPESILEGLRSSFPGPHEREPANLRRDIEDELADHLALATARERAKGLDDRQARAAAIERFGNPRAVARQLWFLAMKEHVMKDRLIIAVNLLLAVVVILAAALIWKISDQSRQSNLALVAALEKLSSRSSAPSQTAPTLASLNVHCTEREPNGPPAAKITVNLRGKPFTESEDKLEQYTDVRGNVTFGPIRPGKYMLGVQARDADGEVLFMNKEVVLYAGQATKEEFVIPDLRLAPATLSISLPEALKKQNVIVTLRFFKKQMTVAGGLWYFANREVAIGPDGKLHLFGEAFRGELESYSIDTDRVTSLTLPAGEVYLAEIGIGINPRRKEASSFEYKAAATKQYNEGNFPGFRIQAGTVNHLNIAIPADLLKQAQIERIMADSKLDKRGVDDGLIEQLPENTKKLIAISNTAAASENQPGESGWSDNFAIRNNSGSAVYLGWPNSELSAEDAIDPGHKFMIAIHAKSTRFSFKDVADARETITADAVLNYWNNNVSWESRPKTEAMNPPIRFDMTPGTGWKFFDITPIVRAQTGSGRRNNGVALRFEKTVAPGQDWSGYDFAGIHDRGAQHSPTRPFLIEIGR